MIKRWNRVTVLGQFFAYYCQRQHASSEFTLGQKRHSVSILLGGDSIGESAPQTTSSNREAENNLNAIDDTYN
jgi:hypothetical protein